MGAIRGFLHLQGESKSHPTLWVFEDRERPGPSYAGPPIEPLVNPGWWHGLFLLPLYDREY